MREDDEPVTNCHRLEGVGMERLTDKNAVGNYFYPKCFEKCDGLGASSKCDNCELTTSICEKLGKYEDLEKQGRLVKLPCKVGNTVYVIVGKNISAQKIQRATIDSEGKIEFCTKRRGFALFDIGKTVFLTKPEAEAKLKELRGGGVNEKTDS